MILYEGSSGSPLYNNQKKVIGQAWAYTAPNCFSQGAYYGKFDVSWDGNDTIPERKLSHWLDPDNTNAMFLDGISYCPPIANFTYQTVTTNTTIVSCGDINVQNVNVTNNTKLTLDAAGEVNINGIFEVESGSELEIN